MGFLNQILESLNQFMSGGVVATIAIVVEFALRLIKTEKPKSIIYGIAGFFKLAGKVFTKIGEVSDKIFGQQIK